MFCDTKWLPPVPKTESTNDFHQSGIKARWWPILLLINPMYSQRHQARGYCRPGANHQLYQSVLHLPFTAFAAMSLPFVPLAHA
jgi:hypothetical protein